jgi:hypothetical protein
VGIVDLCSSNNILAEKTRKHPSCRTTTADRIRVEHFVLLVRRVCCERQCKRIYPGLHMAIRHRFKGEGRPSPMISQNYRMALCHGCCMHLPRFTSLTGYSAGWWHRSKEVLGSDEGKEEGGREGLKAVQCRFGSPAELIRVKDGCIYQTCTARANR